MKKIIVQEYDHTKWGCYHNGLIYQNTFLLIPKKIKQVYTNFKIENLKNQELKNNIDIITEKNIIIYLNNGALYGIGFKNQADIFLVPQKNYINKHQLLKQLQLFI